MSLITDKQITQFHELGYFVTNPVFDKAQLNDMADAFDQGHAAHVAAVAADGAADQQTRDIAKYRPFLGQFHRQSEAAREFVKAPIYLEACAKFIGPDADLYYNQAVIKPPEKGQFFAWHQDSGYVVTEPLQYITCWTAISRTFLDNGCIWVIPRSHKLGLLPHPRDMETNSLVAQFDDESAAIPVEMQAGQVAIFSSLTLHKSGPNVSSEIRRGYVPQYHHPKVTNAATNQLTGDQYPVLRDGKRVDVPLEDPVG